MATYYWVPGGNGNWTSSSNWASSSGGTGGAGVPSISDGAVFDANSGTASTVAILDSSASVLTVVATGYKGQLNVGTNTLTVVGTGSACIFGGNARLVGSVGGKVKFTYSGASSMTVNAGLTAIAVAFIFTAGSYALSFSGSVYDLDFWQSGTGTYTGAVTAGSCSIDGTMSLKSGMTFGGASGILYCYSNSAIRSNGVTVAKDIVIVETTTLLDALSMPSNTLYMNASNTVLNGSGKNVTASGIQVNGTLNFGAAAPTWSCGYFWVQSTTAFSGTGTATISVAASGSVYHYGQRIPATVNLLGNATIGDTLYDNGAFLGLKNSGYGTLTVNRNTTFVEFALKGTVSNTEYLNGSGKTITKVDPWYVGANSTDGGGNTNIVFTAGEGVDYLNVSNVVGAYNYGPHFMAFM